ncbi:hypothetical protein D3C73_1090000 [compost metagenome]
MQRQLLVDLADGVTGGAAGRQCQGLARELLEACVAFLALDTDQHQRDIGGNRLAGTDGVSRLQIQQLARRNQVSLPALQCAEQLVLAFGNDLELDLLAIAGVPVEVLLEGAQSMVFDPDWLPLHFAGTVAALVDQHFEHSTAADLRQIAHLGRRHRLQRTGQARNRRRRKQQRSTQQEQNRGTGHPLSAKMTGADFKAFTKSGDGNRAH